MASDSTPGKLFTRPSNPAYLTPCESTPNTLKTKRKYTCRIQGVEAHLFWPAFPLFPRWSTSSIAH